MNQQTIPAFLKGMMFRGLRLLVWLWLCLLWLAQLGRDGDTDKKNFP